jgi:hypothetical protein
MENRRKGLKMTVNCLCKIHARSFSDWNDYMEFKNILDSHIYFKKIPIEKKIVDVGLNEYWYKCIKCGIVWRLIEPDPPFIGLWEKVT